MNLLVFEQEELSGTRLALADRRASHLLLVLKVEVGQKVRVGLVGQGVGLATVVGIKSSLNGNTASSPVVELEVGQLSKSTQGSKVDLLLALPRPQTLKKVLELVATMGVNRLILCGASRVEKSYFQSKLLKNESYREYLRLGMEQGLNVFEPEFSVVTNLKRGLELAHQENQLRLVFDVSAQSSLAELNLMQSSGRQILESTQSVLMAFGPEGGWSEKELEQFSANSYRSVSLGQYVLRVETAVCAALSKLEMLHELNDLSTANDFQLEIYD